MLILELLSANHQEDIVSFLDMNGVAIDPVRFAQKEEDNINRVLSGGLTPTNSARRREWRDQLGFEFIFSGYYSRYPKPKMMGRSIFNFFHSLKPVLVYLLPGGTNQIGSFCSVRNCPNTSRPSRISASCPAMKN